MACHTVRVYAQPVGVLWKPSQDTEALDEHHIGASKEGGPGGGL